MIFAMTYTLAEMKGINKNKELVASVKIICIKIASGHLEGAEKVLTNERLKSIINLEISSICVPFRLYVSRQTDRTVRIPEDEKCFPSSSLFKGLHRHLCHRRLSGIITPWKRKSRSLP